jgi:hypothetical protein
MSPTKSSKSSLERLPIPGERWVPRRKAALIAAVRAGAISLDDACRRYRLSAEEFAGWLAAFEKHGAPGLRATRFQIYRDPPGSAHRNVQDTGTATPFVNGALQPSPLPPMAR